MIRIQGFWGLYWDPPILGKLAYASMEPLGLVGIKGLGFRVDPLGLVGLKGLRFN